MNKRPAKCSSCIYSDCMLTDAMALSCEIDTLKEKAVTLLEDVFLGISQTSPDDKCPNIEGSVEVWDNMLMAPHGIVRARKCGKWDCPVCGIQKLKRIRKQLKWGLLNRFRDLQEKGITDAWKYMKFLSLTSYHKIESPEKAYKVMAAGWNKLLAAMKRKFGKVEFFKVVEPHKKDDYPHFHAILWIKKYIPFEWIQNKWMKYEIGKFVNINNKTDEFQSVNHVANYVTKYLLKTVGKDVSWFKRWSQSRRFLMKPERIKWWTDYTIHKLDSVDWLYDEKQESGYWIEWHKDKKGFIYFGGLDETR